MRICVYSLDRSVCIVSARECVCVHIYIYVCVCLFNMKFDHTMVALQSDHWSQLVLQSV